MIQGQTPVARQNKLVINELKQVQNNRVVHTSLIILPEPLKAFQELVNRNCKKNYTRKFICKQFTLQCTEICQCSYQCFDV